MCAKRTHRRCAALLGKEGQPLHCIHPVKTDRQKAMDEEQNEKKPRDWSRVKRGPHAYIGVWLSPDQRAYVERQATAAGCSLSEYMRAAAMGVKPIKGRPRLDPDRQLCGKMLGEMGKIGSNLNQIARAMNQQTMLTLEDFRNLREMQNILADMAAIQLKALGREPEP